MAKTDQFRWQGVWRDLGLCRCGREFLPMIPRQQVCERCAESEARAELQEIRRRAADQFRATLEQPTVIPFRSMTGSGILAFDQTTGMIRRIWTRRTPSYLRHKQKPSTRLKRRFLEFSLAGNWEAVENLIARSVAGDDARRKLRELCDEGDWVAARDLIVRECAPKNRRDPPVPPVGPPRQ